MTRILCYELNEVPWKVIDLYVRKRPDSNVANTIASAAQITTRTFDSGELHPWSTWPTMHRGVSNDKHNIRCINQDLRCASDYPPLWELLARSSRTVGIVGCLQSYPVAHHENVLFHVPDTFSPSAETLPAKYSAFQRLNLKLTSENKAIAGRISLRDLLNGVGLLKSGVSLKTTTAISAHLLSERINTLNKSLRPTMQAHVAFDVFMDAVSETKPDYAAFFTNHVAGMMHRYWKFAFPAESGYTLRPDSVDQFHSQSIIKAMDIFDHQLGIIREFSALHGYDVIVSSSMGQEATDTGEYFPELVLERGEQLVKTLRYAKPVKFNLAMQPDIALEFSALTDLAEFTALIKRVVDKDGRRIFRQHYQEKGCKLTLAIQRSRPAAESGCVYFNGVQYGLHDFGLKLITRDPCTGYHQPYGIVFWEGKNKPHVKDRETYDTRQYAPSILRALGVPAPEYMMPPIGM